MAVDVGTELVRPGSQFHVGHIFQIEDFPVRQGAHDNALELAHIVEQSLEFDVDRVDGTLKAADRRYEVLFVDRIDDFIRRKAIHGQHIRLEPDTHAVFVADKQGPAHARDTADGRYHIDVQIVGDKLLVKPVVRALQTDNLQDGVDTLRHRDPLRADIGRQQAHRLVHPVLHVHGRLVGVGTLLEIDRDFGGTVGECRRRDIHHILHAVDLFFERHDDRFHHGVGVSAAVGSAHRHHRGCDIRILLNRQGREAHEADQANQHGHRQGGDPVTDKKFLFPDLLHVILR